MLSLLGTLGAQALRTVIPAAINWGMNKLSNSSGIGRTVIAPAISGAFQPPPHTHKTDTIDQSTPSVEMQAEWVDQEPPKRKGKVKGILKKRKARR